MKRGRPRGGLFGEEREYFAFQLANHLEDIGYSFDHLTSVLESYGLLKAAKRYIAKHYKMSKRARDKLLGK